MPSQTQVTVAKVNGTNKSAVMIETRILDALEPLGVLRLLKKTLPDLYRQVWYEMDVPENGLVLPDNINTEPAKSGDDAG